MPRKTKRRPTLIDLPIRSQPARPATRGLQLPFVSQFGVTAGVRGNDCGPACVRMALDFLGLVPGISIDEMAKFADEDDNGTNWNDLVSLAARYGAVATSVFLPANALPEAPAILLLRYPGFRRESVENQAYWDSATLNPDLWHWAWWLGNEVMDGQMHSVWNDPLYTSDRGKNVHHTIEELNAAFQPYGANRIAIVFPGLKNPPQSHSQAQSDRIPLEVFAFDSQGGAVALCPQYAGCWQYYCGTATWPALYLA